MEGYRVEATALNACWRPLAVRLRTTTTLMGLAGPEQWRTSTLSTKPPRAVTHVLSGLDEMQEAGGVMGRCADDENGPNLWITHCFVCLFLFQGNFLFL